MSWQRWGAAWKLPGARQRSCSMSWPPRRSATQKLRPAPSTACRHAYYSFAAYYGSHACHELQGMAQMIMLAPNQSDQYPWQTKWHAHKGCAVLCCTAPRCADSRPCGKASSMSYCRFTRPFMRCSRCSSWAAAASYSQHTSLGQLLQQSHLGHHSASQIIGNHAKLIAVMHQE